MSLTFTVRNWVYTSPAVIFAVMVTVSYLAFMGPSAAGAATHTPTARHQVASQSAPARLTRAARAQAQQTAARAVFDGINAARRKAGLRTLKWKSGLHRSALAHDLRMSSVNQLSHQLPNEPRFDQRISAEQVLWSAAGENIAWTSVQNAAGALQLNAMMLAEQAPDNGHRLNILSKQFNSVGVDVTIDSAHGRLWLTQDFTRS